MSSLDGSGVYYTPVGFPHHHPDSQEIQQTGYSQEALKQCSVKGCTDTLSSNDGNKMCDACRSRHRIYASTKRAKRKLEKAAMVNVVATRSGKDIQEMPIIEHAAQSITWVTSGGQSHQDLQPSTSATPLQLSSLPTWNQAIDPRLFSGDVSPQSAHHLSPPTPHQTSTSSELANALTPRQPSMPVPVLTSSILPNQTATDYSKHYSDRTIAQQQSSPLQGPPQTHTSVDSRRDDDDSNEEEQVTTSLQATPPQDQHMNNLSSSDQQTSSDTAEFAHSRSSAEADGSTRFCSVKGCKTVIPALYEYKMCPPCRTRYRSYGNTKRAKWKAERDAFDREMASLRTIEDEKRKANGLKPLAESPEELRAWELSIIDEQVPLPDNNAAASTSSVAETGLTQTLPSNAASIHSPLVVAGVYPPSISTSSNVDSPHAVSPYPHLNNNPLLAAAANTSLPARMCTVSHCHKILPGYYRYKRCEQHRLQNRHHSQLKRVREKEVKASGPDEEAPETEVNGSADMDKEDKEAKAALTTCEVSVPPSDASMTCGPHDGGQKDKSHDQKRSRFSCSAGDCHNLLLPTVRWRSCEPCRSLDRRRKNQTKFEQKAAAEKYYWSEKMNVDAQPPDISENQSVTGGNGKAQESQETNQAISAGAVDPDAEGDIDMDDDVDEMEPGPVEIERPPIAPVATLPHSIPPASASMTSGFSRFHVTIDPRHASSSASLDPTTSTSKLVTLDDPLAFRAYRPKTTPSAIGRILARNPGLSVDAFTEVLQAEAAGAAVNPLDKQANSTSTTIPIITPTIPTSAPFVYKAPEKRNGSTRGQGGTGNGKRKAASLEKQPAPSTTPAASSPPSGAVASTAAAPPGPYGAYGFPQYPYPYPYYVPSPYGMPPYPCPQPPPIPSDSKKQKSSSKSSTPAAASSSSSTQAPPSTVIPGYPPYPYPYPPQPYGYLPPPGGYPYMPARYIPGQHPYNGLPPGPSGPNPYPYPYYPPVPAPPAPIPTSASTSASAPFPKTAATARERQRTQDTKFNYYHYGAGSSDSPTVPNDKKRKRRKVDPHYLEKFKAQTEAISMSLQASRDTSSSVPVPTPPSASAASGSSNVAPPVVSAQPETATLTADARAPLKPATATRPCANKTCRRSLPVDTANTLCDKCRLRFKRDQAKAKKRFKLEPRKFLLTGKATSEKQGSVDESMQVKGSAEPG